MLTSTITLTLLAYQATKVRDSKFIFFYLLKSMMSLVYILFIAIIQDLCSQICPAQFERWEDGTSNGNNPGGRCSEYCLQFYLYPLSVVIGRELKIKRLESYLFFYSENGFSICLARLKIILFYTQFNRHDKYSKICEIHTKLLKYFQFLSSSWIFPSWIMGYIF